MDDKEIVENPYYKYWSKSKVGASVESKETTKRSAAADTLAEEDVKKITRKLVSLTAERAVMETVVTEARCPGSSRSPRRSTSTRRR
jgi:hypothetical protein